MGPVSTQPFQVQNYVTNDVTTHDKQSVSDKNWTQNKADGINADAERCLSKAKYS